MDWFERLTGFRETGYEVTRSRLTVDGRELRSLANGRRFGIGELELVSLGELRARAAAKSDASGSLKVGNLSGDVRALHRSPEFAGALFQVASQFNLLEMTGPNVTPEQGVTRYASDPTQGPACAIAAGAATIYRNYFAPVGGGFGQTRERQIDGLADVGAALGQALGRPVEALWTMKNGYALCSREGLAAISEFLGGADASQIDALRALQRIGVHSDVDVTDGDGPGQRVSQAFCSALPVAYTDVARGEWRTFAGLVLEASYEATLWAAVLNSERGASNIVLLTRLGGGAFGNDQAWIDAAMRRALTLVRDRALDVRLVSPRAPPRSMMELESD